MSYTLSPEQFVDYLIDGGGLVRFADLQQQDWTELARSVHFISDGIWQPSPGYLEGVYQMQKELEENWPHSTSAQIASRQMWQERAEQAETKITDLEERLDAARATKRKKVNA